MGSSNRPLFVQSVVHCPVLSSPAHILQHDFNFRTKADLLTEIRRQTHRGGGIPVRALKESWKEAPQAIEEFEKDGDVLVTRTAKDGQLRMVFWNDLKASEEKGGMMVEKGWSASHNAFMV